MSVKCHLQNVCNLITLHRPRFIIYKMESLDLIDTHIFSHAMANFFLTFPEKKNILKIKLDSGVYYKRYIYGDFFLE